MSTPVTINSIVDKLSTQQNRVTPLVFNTPLAKKKLKELNKRITALYIEDTSRVVVATFLQNISLDLFTDNELVTLLQFDYSFIENKTIIGNVNTVNLNKPYYDLSGTIINVADDERFNIDETFQFLNTIHSTLSVEFLLSYILSQV